MKAREWYHLIDPDLMERAKFIDGMYTLTRFEKLGWLADLVLARYVKKGVSARKSYGIAVIMARRLEVFHG